MLLWLASNRFVSLTEQEFQYVLLDLNGIVLLSWDLIADLIAELKVLFLLLASKG